ncbi:MAG TPA: response regulator [Burkholderiales bacterium]|nr:response regulator [Burkholderiales bacterium]
MATDPKSTVLIVDDKHSNLLALSAVLEEDHRLLFAESGEQAIDIVQGQHVDVILMDVQMPGMDGFQAASKIKALDAGRDTPIIFVTAVYNEDPFVRRGYEAGGIDYFAKPFDPAVLRMKVAIYATFKQREKMLGERELRVHEAEELLRVGRKLSAVLESLPVGVMIADIEGRICQMTEQVSRILQFDQAPTDSIEAMLGWWDGAGRLIKDHAGPLARALHGETSTGEALEIECVDGRRKNILVSASPLRGLDGRLVGAVVLVHDLTEPRNIEAALQDRVTRLVSIGVELEEST